MHDDNFGCVGNGKSVPIWSGGFLDLENPQPEDIHLEDIATGLGRACRYGGQCPRFYSVAEHCVSMVVLAHQNGHRSKGLLQALLLHDATEAYIGDVQRPLKGMLDEYKVIERRLNGPILRRFGIRDHTPLIKTYDRYMLVAERVEFWPNDRNEDWPGYDKESLEDVPFYYWDMEEAKGWFLAIADWIGIKVQPPTTVVGKLAR